MRALASRAASAQHGEADLVHRIGRAEMFLQPALVQGAHPEASRLIVNGPETHDHAANARNLEGTTQTEYTLTRFDFAEARVARREHGPLDTAQIQRRDFFRGEDAIVVARTGGAAVGTRKRQARQQQRIVPDPCARPQSARAASALPASSRPRPQAMLRQRRCQ